MNNVGNIIILKTQLYHHNIDNYLYHYCLPHRQNTLVYFDDDWQIPQSIYNINQFKLYTDIFQEISSMESTLKETSHG